VNSAVLFIVFNRPDTTREVFDVIRRARPPRLYVAADGARAARAGEVERCEEVRRIATAVDWPCEVRTLFRNVNLGCKRGVSKAIDWFFEHEEQGIILEDDVVALDEFFPFCDELLDRYRDDERVSMISGCNFVGQVERPDASYAFSRYMHIWGWASWRRAWASYDLDMSEWPRSGRSTLAHALGRREPSIRYWSDIFHRAWQGTIDTWDYQWVFSAWRADMVAIIPRSNMIRNLGFGTDATHTTGDMPAFIRDLEMTAVAFPLRHPDRVEASCRLDQLIEHVVINITPYADLKRRLRSVGARLATALRAAKR
jgi:hypothetical protein